jgi:hypothetical protein
MNVDPADIATPEQTGAWTLPDQRPLPAELVAFLDGGAGTTTTAALKTALAPETRAGTAAVAGTIRTDGAMVAAKMLLDAVSQDRPPVST